MYINKWEKILHNHKNRKQNNGNDGSVNKQVQSTFRLVSLELDKHIKDIKAMIPRIAKTFGVCRRLQKICGNNRSQL